MKNNVIGTRFEKYVQALLLGMGIRAKRNLMYHKGRRRCQVDLEYRQGLILRERFIMECKYVGPGSSLDFGRAYTQLGEALLFTGFDNGIIVTNAPVQDRKKKEDDYRVQLYDLSVLFALRGLKRGTIESRLKQVEEEIRSMPYDKGRDHRLIHRYL